MSQQSRPLLEDEPPGPEAGFKDDGAAGARSPLDSRSRAEGALQFSFVDQEPLNGVPTRILKPREWSAFSSFAFSPGGKHIATGEITGFVRREPELVEGLANRRCRLWSTADYSPVAQAKADDKPIACLSFADGDDCRLVAVAADGRVYRCRHVPETNLAASGGRKGRAAAGPADLGVERGERLVTPTPGLSLEPRLHHQISGDGLVVLQIVSTGSLGSPGSEIKAMQAFRVHGCAETRTIRFGTRRAEGGFPLLSEDGLGLLMCSAEGPTEVLSLLESSRWQSASLQVWPRLDFDAAAGEQTCVALDGRRAVWGRRGEFVLLWRSTARVPRLVVYRTGDLVRFGRRAKPFAERELHPGQTDWKAVMLQSADRAEAFRVLIQEASSSGKRRILVWEGDGVSESVAAELVLDTSPDGPSAEEPPSVPELRATAAVPSSHPASVRESVARGERVALGDRAIERELAQNPITEDVFPTACMSHSHGLVAVVSWSEQTCVVCSSESRTAVWNCRFPEGLRLDPRADLPVQALFDPQGDDLLVLGDRAIYVFPAPFLSDDTFQISRRLTSVFEGATEAELFGRLPSSALAAALGDADSDDCILWLGKVSQYVPDGCLVMDAAVSAAGRRLALVVSDPSGTAALHGSIAVYCVEEAARGAEREAFGGLSFPLSAGSAPPFSPGRVLLHDTQTGADCGMALFSTGERPLVLFCDVARGSADGVVSLKDSGVTRALRICQTDDRRLAVILDVRSVALLRLERRRVERRIEYKINFSDALGAVFEKTGRRHERGLGFRDTARRVSDDGEKVLLAWDANQRRSVAADPETDQTRLDEQIESSVGCLSEFCALSPDGRTTCFAELDAARAVEVKIGVFSETVSKVCYRVRVAGHVDAPIRVLSLGQASSAALGSGLGSGGLEEGPVLSPTDRRSSVRPDFLGREGDFDWFPQKTQQARGMERHVPVRIGGSKFATESNASDRRTPAQILSGVFYGLNRDFSEMVIGTRRFFPEGQGQRAGFVLKSVGFYGTEDCLPTRARLLAHGEGSIERRLSKLREKFGPYFMNKPVRGQMSLFQEAFEENDDEIVEGIAKVAAKSGAQIALEWPSQSEPSGRCNVLRHALASNSTNQIDRAIDLLCSNLTPFTSAARIAKGCFLGLWKRDAETVRRILSARGLVFEMCQLSVHVDFLSRRHGRDRAVHIGTSDSALGWMLVESEERREQMWRRRNERTVARMEAGGDTSTARASLSFVCIEDAAQVGMRGIIRPLLLGRAPASFFELDVVRAVVDYKWCQFWSFQHRMRILHQMAFLIVFTAYAILFGDGGAAGDAGEKEQIAMLCFLFASWSFGVRMLRTELAQIRALMADGRAHYGGRKQGLLHYFSSKWNIRDLTAGLLLVSAIPIFHCLAHFDDRFEGSLSVFIALQAILSSVKFWNLAQPYRSFGPLVLMVQNVVVDSLAFLLLTALVIFGFSLALHVLFVAVAVGDDEELEGAVNDAHGTFPRSLLTVFYATFGDFDAQIYTEAGNMAWVITLVFAGFMVTVIVLLLNLLIAIMGDTFDRVKSTEVAQMLMARAQFIDACELEMGQQERKRLENKIGKYVHVLRPVVKRRAVDGDPDSWQGRVHMITKSVEETFERSKANLQDKMDKLCADVEQREQRITERLDKLLEALTAPAAERNRE